MSFFGYVPPENPSRNPSQYFNSSPNVADVEVRKKGKFSGLLGSLAGMALPIIGSGVQYLFDSLAAKKQRKIAKQQWDEMNAYNSPSAQLARFKAAGINPAYGNATMNNSAAQFSNASTTVARPEVPQYLTELSKYQSMRNAGIEEKILNERLVKERLNKVFLDYTLGIREDQEKAKLSNMLANYDSTVQRTENMAKLGAIEYLLKNQDFENKSVLNPLIQELQKIALSMSDAGLNSSDSTFLRMLNRKNYGSKQANSLFPYMIGDRMASFSGDLLKIAVPSGIIGKMWQSTSPLKNLGKLRPNGMKNN